MLQPVRVTQTRLAAQPLPTLCLSAVEILVEGDALHGRLLAYEGGESFRELKETSGLFAYRLRSASEQAQVLIAPLIESAPQSTAQLPLREYQPATQAAPARADARPALPGADERPRVGLTRAGRAEGHARSSYRRRG